MSRNRPLKHLPLTEWPVDDRRLFDAALTPGDIFDEERAGGAHFSKGTRKSLIYAWRRWLGFLKAMHPTALEWPAAEHITPSLVRAYIETLDTEVSATSVATMVAHFYCGARLVAPDHDWSWFEGLKRRLQARAHSEDRFERLVPPHQTLDLGIALMETADTLPASARKEREIQFRDGLIIAVLSLWPIRRRSIAALTLLRHVHRVAGDEHIEILLFPEDTKSKREESWPVPVILRPYLRRYLDEVRPRLLGGKNHDALWVGLGGRPLHDGGISLAVGRRTKKEYGQAMAPHDFRRSAATFLAAEAPEKVGLVPGILQHATPETGDRYYNLARSVSASRRHVATLSALKSRLRPATR